MISRSLGVVTVTLAWVVMHSLLSFGASGFVGFAEFLGLALQLAEQRVEALEAHLPELAVTLEPLGGFRERLGFEPARSSLCIAAARDQARPFQHLEVLG